MNPAYTLTELADLMEQAVNDEGAQGRDAEGIRLVASRLRYSPIGRVQVVMGGKKVHEEEE